MPQTKPSQLEVGITPLYFVCYVSGENSLWCKKELIKLGGVRGVSQRPRGYRFQNTEQRRQDVSAVILRTMGLIFQDELERAEPEMPRMQCFSAYFSKETEEELKALSVRLKVPAAEIIRQGVELALKKWKDAPGPGLALPE